MIDRESLNELRELCEDLDLSVTDDEARSIGERILRFIRATQDLNQSFLTPQEQTVFDLIKAANAKGESPSVRKSPKLLDTPRLELVSG
jgi:hypothetical protein